MKTILSHIPEGKISDAVFEGANIVLYTKDKDFFLENTGIVRDGNVIKKIVDDIKKRVELRPDPEISMDPEKAELIIRENLPEESGVDKIIFDKMRSIVEIEVEKPGVAIGKQGQLLRDIREKTHWVPVIKRRPAIRSQIIEDIKAVLYQNNDWRRKFLDRVGHRIYDGWIRGKKEEWIRLSVLGSGRQVGRSCFLLQTPESRVMLDCGINVAADSEPYPYLESPEFRIKELDAVVVSHAHLDHIGFLPYLFKFGYDGPVYCTPPTRDIMSLIQLDFVKIQKFDGLDPIYTSDEIRECLKHTITLDFEEVTDITPDVRLTLYNSGHILGSSMVHLHIGNGLHNFLYTGDLKYCRTHLLEQAATQFPRLETLEIESTYGGKDNNLPTEKEGEQITKDIIKRTVDRGGKILCPVLGTGRAQEVMMIIEEMYRKGELPKDLKVFVDGIVWDITAIHTAHPEYLNSNIRKQIFHKDNNPFLSPIFHRVGSKKERDQVIEEEGSCMILATSGMLVGGPSVEYLRALADNPRNSLLFTSYQGEGTLGRRLQRGEREIVFKDGAKQEVVQVKMEISRLEISSHSDRRQLMNFLTHLNPRPKKVLVSHGEPSRCLDFASSIHRQLRVETVCPRNLETIRLR